MFWPKWKSALGVVVSMIALALSGLPTGSTLGQGIREPSDDSLGYTAFFKGELQKLGQISPEEFARRYPSSATYLDKLSWDPTSATFWADFNRDPKEPRQTQRSGTFDFRLNATELAKFKQNGFVVSERLGADNFAEVFYRIYSRDLPVFVSTDALLHAWHRSYDGMLEDLEETYLATSLDEILTAMAQNIPAAEKEYGNGLMGDSLKDADYFLAVARSLLADKQVPTTLNQEGRVAETLRAVEGQRLHKFILFGRQRDMDFSQFKVRGHYENSALLKQYFKAMMWCG